MYLKLNSSLYTVALCYRSDADPTDACPSNLSRDNSLRVFEDHCYEFVLDDGDYWSEALSDCKSKGGNLVDIQSSAEQGFIYNTANVSSYL